MVFKMMLLLMMMIMMFRRMMIMIIVILTDSSSGTYSEALWCYERCLAIKILAAGLKIIDTSIFYSFISLSIHISLSTPLFANLDIYLIYLTYLPIYLPTHLPIYLPTYLPIYLPTYLPTYIPIYLPTYLSIILYHIIISVQVRPTSA
jgi:hypothetical protein